MIHLGHVRGRATTQSEHESISSIPKEVDNKGTYKKLVKFIQNLCSSFSKENAKKTKVTFPSKFPIPKVPKIFLQRRLNRDLNRQFTLKTRVRCPKIKIRTYLEKEAIESSSLKQAHETKLRKDKQERFDKILMGVRRWNLMQGIAKPISLSL